MEKSILTIVILSLTLTVSSQALSNDTLHWAEYRKLTWDDFKGEPIDLPGMAGQEMTVMLANFKKAHLLLPAMASVVTIFDRNNSWAADKSRTSQQLKYYQLTFDLHEVYSRKLRKEYSQTKFGLDPNTVFQQKYNTALTALSDRNKLLMKETKMGQDSAMVDKWAATIETELKELDAFRVNGRKNGR